MTGRLRILRLIARMNVGGPALQVTGLQRGLDPQEFESRLLVGSVDSGEADYLRLRAPDVKALAVPGLGRSIRATGEIKAFRFILREMREFRPHIVHTHTAKAGMLGRVAARRCGVPITVHTFHGHLLHSYFSTPVTALVRATERHLANGTSRLAAVGVQVRDELIAARIGAPEQYVVIPPGVEDFDPPSRSEARRALGLSLHAPVVAFVARLTAVKRVDRALEAFSLLQQQVPAAILLIVGEGPMLEGAREEAARFGDSVRFLGWRGDVEEVYAAADVALLTSDNEGMPVALIEAAMCGVPAVATAVGSVSEVVEHGKTGLVVGPESKELASALQTLTSSSDLRSSFGRAARVRALDRFSSQRLVSDTEELYRALAASVGIGE